MVATAETVRRGPLSDADLLEMLALPESLHGQPIEAEIELTEEEKKFQEERRYTLGGTDLAAIAGLSSFRNAWDVAAEKRGILPPSLATERMQWGNLLEDPVAREYARRTGQRLRRLNTVVRDRDLPFLGGHPDRLVIGARKGVEVKTVEFGREKWSEVGQPVRVPKDYYVQCQHYLGVLRYEAWDLVALFGLQRMRWYTLEPNEKVIAALREKGQEFWERYVAGAELPPIEPSDRAFAWLKATYPRETGDTLVVASELQAEAISKWREAKKNREAWEKAEEKWKLHVQQAIGSARGIASGNLTVTWTKNRDTVALVTDWQALLQSYAERLGFSVSAEDIAQFTQQVTTREGPRVMRVKENRS